MYIYVEIFFISLCMTNSIKRYKVKKKKINEYSNKGKTEINREILQVKEVKRKTKIYTNNIYSIYHKFVQIINQVRQLEHFSSKFYA